MGIKRKPDVTDGTTSQANKRTKLASTEDTDGAQSMPPLIEETDRPAPPLPSNATAATSSLHPNSQPKPPPAPPKPPKGPLAPPSRISKLTPPKPPIPEGDKTTICITRKTKLGAYLRRCRRLFDEGHATLTLYAMGAAIPHLTLLSTSLPLVLPGGVLRQEVTTTSVSCMDEIEPEDEDVEGGLRRREKAGLRVRVWMREEEAGAGAGRGRGEGRGRVGGREKGGRGRGGAAGGRGGKNAHAMEAS